MTTTLDIKLAAIEALRESGFSDDDIEAIVFEGGVAGPTPAVGSTAEIPSAPPEPVADVVELPQPEEPPPNPWRSVCAARSGLNHFPCRYELGSDNTVYGTCVCGLRFPTSCPHPGQILRGRDVVCNTCGMVEIKGTGSIDNRNPDGSPRAGTIVLGVGDQLGRDAYRGDG